MVNDVGTGSEACALLHLQPFPEQQQQQRVAQRLAEVVADVRVEKATPTMGRLQFYWRSLWADPASVAVDVWGYAPWRMPFRMGRLTAAAMVSIVFLLLGAEAWEVGVNTTYPQLLLGAICTIMAATAFLFWGKNLGEVSRNIGWREQLVRTRSVVFFTLLIGMSSLWLVLFALAYLAALYVPADWLGGPLAPRCLASLCCLYGDLGRACRCAWWQSGG